MTVLLGLPRETPATATVQLAALLARSRGEPLVLCAVVPRAWPAGPAKIDAEYQDWLDEHAAGLLEAARQALPAGQSADVVTVRARSTPAGLLEAAARLDASLLVLGSSTGGVLGRVSLGSVADHVLHTAPLPVALAPRGFRTRPDATVRRVTVAYAPSATRAEAHGGSSGSADGAAADVVTAAAALATATRATLRVASFAVRSGPVVTAGVGFHAEDDVVREWTAGLERAQAAVLAGLDGAVPPERRETAVGSGRDWADAVEGIGWDDGDLLVVGSSSAGALARVFLGSRSSKIVRNSPVPVVVVPRSAVDG